MRYIVIIIVIIVVFILGYTLYNLYSHKLTLQDALRGLNLKLMPLVQENERLMADIEYFQDVENVEKELRANFNYAKPGEEMVIVVPKD